MNRKAFTLIEALIGMCVVVLLFSAIFKITGFVGHNVVKETSELQNLQSVRSAINSIRRDFIVATPKYVADSDFGDNYNIRLDPIISESYNKDGSQPMQIQIDNLLLYRRTLSGDYEEISYVFNENDQMLVRTSTLGKERRFTGIKKVEFKLYYLDQQLNPYIPLLWVSMTVENGHGRDAKTLTVGTSLAANTICQDLNNLYWNSSL